MPQKLFPIHILHVYMLRKAKIRTKYNALDEFLRVDQYDFNYIGLLAKSHININPLCRIQNWKSTSTNILINNSVS